MFKQANHYLSFLKGLIEAKVKNKSVPLIVILCVTNKCNLRCQYCYAEHHSRFDWTDFTKEELLDIVTRLRNLGTKILQFQGGEPLLRNDLGDIIQRARGCNMVTDMVTNGILIPERRDIISLLDKICVSLDGPKKLNDKNRGEGSFDKAVEGIEVANSSGLPVRMSAVLTSDTSFNDIDWLLDFASSRNMLVNFSPSFDFITRTENNKIKPHDIPDDYLRQLFRYIQMRKKQSGVIQFTPRSYDIAVRWPFSYQKRMAVRQELSSSFIHPRCYHGKYVFFIDSDGSVYPCCNFWGRAAYNIRSYGVQESILNVKRNGCEACYIPAYIDRNLFFDGVAGVWWNYIKQSMREKI